MDNPREGVESVAEMIARLVCDYEARQAAEGKKVHLKRSGCLVAPFAKRLRQEKDECQEIK